MKGTRMWTQVGSPLIRGRSRRERALWRDWCAASFGAWLIAAPLAVVLFDGLSGVRQATELAAVACAASLIISGPIVWFVRRLGADRPWRGSALLTAALAPLAMFLYSYISAIGLGR